MYARMGTRGIGDLCQQLYATRINPGQTNRLLV